VDGILGDAAFRPEDVEAIEVTAIPFAARMTGWYPAGMLDAKFSIPYALAARIVTGRSDPTAFLGPIIADERVRKLAARVTVATDPTMSMQRSDPPQARVRVRLCDGRILRRNTPVIRGDARNPASQVDLEAKFRMLAEPVIGTSTAERVIRHISRLEMLPDLREILIDLREAASVGAASAVGLDPVPTISR